MASFLLPRLYTPCILHSQVWDVNMEREPLQTIHVHDHLRQHLCDLYENDFIFDKFECVMSGDSKLRVCTRPHRLVGGAFCVTGGLPCVKACLAAIHHRFMMTGSYHNMFYVYDWEGKVHSTIEASKAAPKRRHSVKGKAGKASKSAGIRRPPPYESMDLNKKVCAFDSLSLALSLSVSVYVSLSLHVLVCSMTMNIECVRLWFLLALCLVFIFFMDAPPPAGAAPGMAPGGVPCRGVFPQQSVPVRQLWWVSPPLVVSCPVAYRP